MKESPLYGGRIVSRPFPSKGPEFAGKFLQGLLATNETAREEMFKCTFLFEGIRNQQP